METSANPTPPPQSQEDGGPSIDPMEIARFVVAAARRNPLTCVLAALITVGIGLAAIAAIPRKFESTSKVYVSQSGAVLSQLTSGRRSMGDENALKDIRELVFTRENFISLVRDAQLVENWPKTRNWLQQLVDRVRSRLYPPTSEVDMEDMLAEMLEPLIEVRSEDSSSIRFRAAWRDAASAQKLTMLLQRNYIASKEVEELAVITRATNVLEDELKRADSAFEPAVTELKNQIAELRNRNKGKTVARSLSAAVVDNVVSRPSGPPLELAAKLSKLREEERGVLEPWQRRNAEIKLQLADLRAVYGPAHPAVVQLENKLRAASAEPMELLDIRQREADLKTSIAGWVGGSSVTRASTGTARGPQLDAVSEIIGSISDDPSLAPARLQLETALRKSAEMQTRLDAARMELAIAQVSFRYRYRQIEPAKLWPKPIKPKVPALIAGAVAGALVVGFLAGAGREVLNGKIMETWQIKQVGLDVIATVDVRSWQLPAPTSRRSLPPPPS